MAEGKLWRVNADRPQGDLAEMRGTPLQRPGGRAQDAPTAICGSPALEAEGISHGFETEDGWLPVLENVSVSARTGELISIIGPSGCGKSTLFTILAGLTLPSAGTVLLDGADVTGKLGLVGFMPQKDLLLPWKTVLDNAILPLQLLGVRRSEAREEGRSWFQRFGLAGFERHYPATLSGGMRQRAALLRTFLSRRDTLLLDEPFGALDALTRLSLQEWLLDVWRSFGKTIIMVTHDVDEAIFLSDRIYVLAPRPAFVARIVDVSLRRPRSYQDVSTSSEFAALKRSLLELLIPAAADIELVAASGGHLDGRSGDGFAKLGRK
jgi:ABC-type nitrate/sulfonate/bicarbonate transport system ATPase subunit